MMPKDERLLKLLRQSSRYEEDKQLASLLATYLSDGEVGALEQHLQLAKKNLAQVRVEKKIDARAREVAEVLRRYVVSNYPHYESTVNVDRWAEDIAKIPNDDGRFTYELIMKVVRFLFEGYQPVDDFDWREQVRSGLKLRKHFVRLLDVARKQSKAHTMETIG